MIIYNKYIIILFLLFLTCGKTTKVNITETINIKKPSYLIITKEITGKLFGDNINQPYGVAIDIKGNIYFSDYGNDRLVQLSPDFIPQQEIGGFGKTAGLLNRPTFIMFDNGLNMMVADEGNRRINRYNSQLVYVDEIPFYDFEDPQKFGYPSGIVFSDYGEVWIADKEYNRIAVFNNIGVFDRYIGDYGYTGGQLNIPEKIIVDDRKNFIVCDAGNSRLMIYDAYGNFLKSVINSKFNYPISAFYKNNQLWVLDGAEGKIYLLGQDNNIIYESGPAVPGSTTAIKEPSDILMLTDETLLITDTGNNRLLVCRIVYE